MATLIYANQFVSKTLSGAINSTSITTGITLDGVTGVEIAKPSMIAVTWADPLDEDVVEWIEYTTIDGSNELQGVTRGGEGGTKRTHVDGATVAFPITEAHINRINDKLTGVDTTVLIDSSGNTLLKSGTNLVQTPTELILPVEAATTNLSTGDGKFFFSIPPKLNGMNFSTVWARVITAPTDAALSITIVNVTQANAEMLSTALTIDATETTSSTAAVAAVIDTGEDDVATNDLIYINIDQVGSTLTGAGLEVRMGFTNA